MIQQSIRNFSILTKTVSQVNKLFYQGANDRSFNIRHLSYLMPELSKKVNVIFVLGPPGSGK